MQPLRIAVVIPVYNAALQLRACLESLRRSSYREFECIVVDDGSTDESAAVAREFGVRALSTGGRKGPACARNIGARAAADTEILFFVDSDVCVFPGTLARIGAAFEHDPELDALIGSYDDSPDSPDFISQYKNLMHCYVHQHAKEEASTFWSGCGAIKRSVFLEFAGFDEQAYQRPAIEDIELGYRLYSAGRKMVLDRQLQVKHLKKWTFWGLIKTDIQDRGIPWTELILRQGRMPDDLNVQLSQRVSVALVFLLVGLSLAMAVWWRGYFLTPLFAAVLFLLSRYWVEAAVGRNRGAIAAICCSMAAIVTMAWMYHMLGLIPPLLLAMVVLFFRHRYSRPNAKRIRMALALIVCYAIIAIVSTIWYLPHHRPFMLAILGVFALVVALNSNFYIFLAGKKGGFFAIAAIPFHLLYHFYNGISFCIGLVRYVFKTNSQSAREIRTDQL